MSQNSLPATSSAPSVPAPVNGFQRWVDRLLGAEVLSRSPSTVRRMRMSVSSALSLVAISGLIALPLTFWLEGLSPAFWMLFVGVLLTPLTVWLPRWTRSDTLPGIFTSMQSVAVIVGMSLSGGVVGAVAPSWHVMVPLSAGLLAGPRAALALGSVSVVHVAFLIAQSVGLAPLAENGTLWVRVSLLVLIFFTSVLAWLYETARERAEEELESKHRDERKQLEKELEIATRIQSSILPGEVEVPGLEMAARMLPASTVGGDYYDILPVEGGCWFGIGDVSGHGLDAGLIMMMLQSTISGLSRYNPKASPRELLNLSNQVLFQNIRKRLKRDDYITLALLRYSEDGEVVVAGAHEELLLYRAREGRCERLETRGAWIGAMRSIERFTVDTRFHLEPGDALLLYTDGLTEARNTAGEMFGLDRLAAEFERACQGTVAQIADQLVGAVAQWSESPQDDRTVLVLRHRGVQPVALKKSA